jgi:hypothetical protein
MRQHLSAAQVAELAELLADAPRRAGLVDEVLQAAAEGRGMTLLLADPPAHRSGRRRNPASRGAPRVNADANHKSGGRR